MQVFKFSPGIDDPTLVLGQAFEPAETNTDRERLCKPTDVAVASSGEYLVAGTVGRTRSRPGDFAVLTLER